MPEVSTVIPAFNAAATVGLAVDSVLEQTAGDVEVIVVDDGSADSTSEAADRGEGVEVVRTENRGVSAARNEGIARAKGKFVAFLDADDYWEPEKLERQLALLERQQDAVMAVTGTRETDSEGRILRAVTPWVSDDPCRDLLLHSQVMGSVSSPLVRRDQLSRIGGFDRRFSQCADWDFFLRAALAGQIATIADPLVVRTIHGTNMSSDIALLERDTFAVLDAFLERPEAQRYANLRSEAYSNHLMILSGSYLHAGSIRSSVRCLAAGLRIHPRNVRRPLGAPIRWAGRLTRRRADADEAVAR